MKIVNNSATVNTSALIARYKPTIITTSKTSAPVTPQYENINYLQQAYTSNKHAQGLLKQLHSILTQFIDNPVNKELKAMFAQGVSQLQKTHPQYAGRLSNKEANAKGLITELEQIIVDIRKNTQGFKKRISEQMIATQNTVAAQHPTSKDVLALTAKLIKQPRPNLIDISTDKTTSLLK